MNWFITVAMLLAGLWSGYLFASWRAAAVPRKGMFLALYDGAVLHVSAAKRTDTEIVGANHRLPVGLCQFHQVGGIDFVFSGVEAVPLADHNAVMRARRSVVLSSLFKSNGDLLTYLLSFAVVCAIVFPWLSYGRAGDTNTAVLSLASDVALVKKVISEPLACSASPAPVVAPVVAP